MIFNLDGRRDYHLYKYSSRLFLLYMPLPVSRSFQDTFYLVRENQAYWQKTKSTFASVPIHLHVMFMHIVAMFLSLIYQYLYINGISVSLLCNNSLLFMTYTFCMYSIARTINLKSTIYRWRVLFIDCLYTFCQRHHVM